MPIRKSRVSGIVASGTTADRPSSPAIGDTFFNGTLGVQEIYTSSGWLPATGANDFNIVLTGSETSVTLDKEYFAGAYTVSSALSDNTFDLYLFDTSNNAAGYTKTPSVNATSNFNKVLVYGGTSGDLLSFAYKTTFTTATSTTDTFAAPYITSVSVADLPNIDDATTITGGNFDTDIEVWFDGQNDYSEQAKSVVYGSSTSVVATRPDNFLEDNSPYTIRVVNPGTTSPTGSNKNKLVDSVTAGGDPVWVTDSGALDLAALGQAYSTTVQATDPDGGTIVYSISTGSLPTGLSLNSSTGEISGTPTTLESQTFVISATDTSENITNRGFSIETSEIATGGSVTDLSGYRMHTFTSSGTFVLNFPVDADILVVGGGGSGGGDNGGGAGAGGLVFRAAESVSSGTYSILVGAGAASRGTNPNPDGGITGNPTEFGSLLVALGGGAGGAQDRNAGQGGSGGGGSWNSSPAAALQPASASGGFGNDGGAGNQQTNQGPGGGGGGAGAAGQSGQGNQPGNGGIGRDYSAYFGTSVGETGYFAGGGGGGSNNSEFGGETVYASQGKGGLGGGGDYGAISSWNGGPGAANTGGGGAGGGYDGTTVNAGGSGGSGVVIVRYPI